MKYWEIIADRLSTFGWSWKMTSVNDAKAGNLFSVEAHRPDVHGRFITRSDDLLTVFLDLDQRLTDAVAEQYRDAP